MRQWVQPGSWFHLTECLGPVLGLMRAADLAEAVQIQNATRYGLTRGIHSLDAEDVGWWLDRVEVGNAYVNRPTTGAIVQRQPFGGWTLFYRPRRQDRRPELRGPARALAANRTHSKPQRGLAGFSGRRRRADLAARIRGRVRPQRIILRVESLPLPAAQAACRSGRGPQGAQEIPEIPRFAVWWRRHSAAAAIRSCPRSPTSRPGTSPGDLGACDQTGCG